MPEEKKPKKQGTDEIELSAEQWDDADAVWDEIHEEERAKKAKSVSPVEPPLPT